MVDFCDYLVLRIASFKNKQAIGKFIGEMQKESGIVKSGLDAMPLFLLDDLLSVPLHLRF